MPTALVTGATAGIGKEIARGLVRRGFDVILGVRDAARGEAVRAELAAEGRGVVSVLEVDVASVRSVRAAVAELECRHDRLDVLVNNAGAWFTDRRESVDGIELTFATNVLGPHLLVRGLEPLLGAAGGRVVNVASSLATDYDPEDLEFRRRRYDGFKVYSATKQALRLLTWGQAARLADRGVTVNAAAPGFVRTGFNRNARGFMATVIAWSARLFAVTPEKGAETPLWVATAPELAGVTARYFEDRTDKEGGHRDPTAVADLERRLDALVAERASVRAPSTVHAIGGVL